MVAFGAPGISRSRNRGLVQPPSCSAPTAKPPTTARHPPQGETSISQPVVLAYIDEPDGRSVTARGPALIRGWILGVASPVSRVEVSLDGGTPARANLYRHRPDLAGAAACERIRLALEALANGAAPGVAAEDAALAGFEFRTDTRHLDAGRDRVRVTIAVTFLDGTCAHLEPAEMMLAPASQACGPAGKAMPQKSRRLPARRRPIEGRIRLLCVARSLDRGGSQLRMKELIGHLQASRRFDTVVVTPVDGPLRAGLEATGAIVHVAPMPVNDIAAYGEALETVTAWAATRFDLVLAFTLTSFFGVDLANRLALPSVWRIGENEPVTTVLQRLGADIDPQVEARAQCAFATASVVLCVSDSTLRVHRRTGSAGRFGVLRNSVNVAAARAAILANDRSACRASLRIDPDRRVLICAGTLWPMKGQALLISALAHVRAEHPELECVIIGQQVDPYATVLPRLIERTGLADVVRLVPFTDDLAPWWCAADVALCPSESEGLPTSVLEAMAFGLPVLASRVAGLPEVVEDGVTGWLCEPSDLASLIAAIRRVAMADSAQLRKLGQAATARVAQRHERSEALARMTGLLDQVACGGRPSWLEDRLAAERGVVPFIKRSWRTVSGFWRPGWHGKSAD